MRRVKAVGTVGGRRGGGWGVLLLVLLVVVWGVDRRARKRRRRSSCDKQMAVADGWGVEEDSGMPGVKEVSFPVE